MTTWVIGDIQGCFDPFQRLLDKVAFDPSKDTLWSVGDLINRGHDNLSTLRWFYENRHAVKVVLGNHDLHLLATRAGFGRLSQSDNFDDILSAPDGGQLMDWLQEQPLIHKEGDDILVHAGIPPCWSIDDALEHGLEVANILQSEQTGRFFQTMYGNEPHRWSPHLRGLSRLRVITNYFTRMRFCTASGALDLKSKGSTAKKSLLHGEPLLPWFQHPRAEHEQARILFGHWAALEGKTDSGRFVGLDTGCVWGGHLTLLNLATNEIQCHNCHEGQAAL